MNRRASWMLAIVVFALAAPALASADEPIPVRSISQPALPTFGGYGGLYLGMLYLDVNDIEDFLGRQDPAADVDPFQNIFPTWGLQAHALLFQKFVLGGRFGSYIQYVGGDRFDAALGGYYGWVDFGYNAYNSLYFNVRPTLGIGGMGMNLLLDGDLRNVRFVDDEDRADDSERAVLLRGSGIVSLGLTLDATPYFVNRFGGFGGMSIQLYAGGFLELFNTPWRYHSHRVERGPSVHANGLLLSLSVLFGGGTTQAL